MVKSIKQFYKSVIDHIDHLFMPVDVPEHDLHGKAVIALIHHLLILVFFGNTTLKDAVNIFQCITQL